MWYVSSNRDETRYEDPDRFDVRRNPEYQAFGAGGRHLPGHGLARLELQILLDETLTATPRWRSRATSSRVALSEPAEDAAGAAVAVKDVS